MRIPSVVMIGRVKSLSCSNQLSRTYITSSYLQIPKREVLPNPHVRGKPGHYIKTRGRKHKPLLTRPLRDLSSADENAQSRAEIQRKALQLCKTWSTADSLVEPVPRPKNHGESAGKKVTNMTTNFMIYLPHWTTYRTSETPKLDKSQILHNIQILLLKRNPHADPFPNGWTAISGRLEADQSGTLESPIDSALREIKEETNQEPVLFGLEAALPPFTIQSPDSKVWRVWPILWRRQLPLDEHGFPVDEIDGLSDSEEGRKIASLLDDSVRLNGENVEFRWTKWVGMDALPGLVPGLAGNFERLVDRWVAEENSRDI